MSVRIDCAGTRRVAISNHRLVALADGNVTFRWRDSAHGNKKLLMTRPPPEDRDRPPVVKRTPQIQH